ncbi:hypothetical protein [uncultured Sphingomonas sp.]|uniref:rolling circle replication-associated protein n=1 Tax=uncultured Sphingomonas sp. TaxID=158754 RepID=UPI0025F426C4|nr:hypothetical protein [uncultured Sphingomonas sp.]
MCINPTFIWMERGPKWEKVPMPCKECWRCKKNRVNDYVGRALAEAATSERVCTLTLTYAPRDDLADKLLHPRHFQLFMKLLRRAGHKVRYLVAGEYGDLRGRAHFHCILFFQELARPDYDGPHGTYNPDHLADPLASRPFGSEIPQMRMSHIREWPHGHIFCDWNADERSIRYVCKYLLADDKNRAWFSLSKKPALGAAWFAQKAQRARELGVLPSTFTYVPPGGDPSRPVPITGASRRDYLNAITMDPADLPRMSDWARKTFEKHARARLMDELEHQPPEVLAEQFVARRDDLEERQREARLWAYLREAGELEDLLLQSDDNTLRRVGRKWVPNRKETSDGTSST